jgi:hypothetical protein
VETQNKPVIRQRSWRREVVVSTAVREIRIVASAVKPRRARRSAIVSSSVSSMVRWVVTVFAISVDIIIQTRSRRISISTIIVIGRMVVVNRRIPGRWRRSRAFIIAPGIKITSRRWGIC